MTTKDRIGMLYTACLLYLCTNKSIADTCINTQHRDLTADIDFPMLSWGLQPVETQRGSGEMGQPLTAS